MMALKMFAIAACLLAVAREAVGMAVGKADVFAANVTVIGEENSTAVVTIDGVGVGALKDLPAFTKISGDLIIKVQVQLNEQERNALKTMLCSLQAVGGETVLQGNIIRKLNLCALEAVGGNFVIEKNNRLTSISAPLLETIDGYLYVGWKMKSLESIDFPSLKNVAGYIEFEEITGPLTELVFPALVSVGDEFVVYENPNIVTISAPLLETIDYYLYVGDKMTSLESIDFPSLKNVAGYIEFEEITGPLTELVFPALVSVGDEFEVDENPNIVTISAPLLETIDGYLYVGEKMKSLESINLPSLGNITGYVWFEEITGPLTELVFPALMSVGEEFEIDDIRKMVTLSAPLLESIDGYLYIGGNMKSLESINLPSLGNITGYFWVEGITGPLTELVFPSLVSVSGHFKVENLKQLRIVSAPLFFSAEGDVSIRGNPSLRLLTLPSLTTVNNVNVTENQKLISAIVPSLTEVGEFNVTGNKDSLTYVFGDLNAMAPDTSVSLLSQYRRLHSKCFRKQTDPCGERCKKCSTEALEVIRSKSKPGSTKRNAIVNACDSIFGKRVSKKKVTVVCRAARVFLAQYMQTA